MPSYTHNVFDFIGCLLGIIMAKSLCAKSIIIKGDTKLVINSLSNKC